MIGFGLAQLWRMLWVTGDAGFVPLLGLLVIGAATVMTVLRYGGE